MKMRLRGIGGLAEAPAVAPEGTAGRLFEMADEMAGTAEVVEGVWVRRIQLENPLPLQVHGPDDTLVDHPAP